MVHSSPQPLLWDPADEKSSCGVGFITRKDGVQGHDVIERAREALCSVPHRGGVSALGVGDGGGVSMDLSQSFFRKVTGHGDLNLGQFCVGNFFLPTGDGATAAAKLIERVMTDRGFTTLTVRSMPVDDSVLPPAAIPLQLPITQWVFAAPTSGTDPAGLDRLIQQALLQIESIGFTRPELRGLYPLSLSARTQVLKGRLSSPEVVDYFLDLADPDHRVHTLFFHTRFSTNTDPHPTMAQPFRYLAHNGELNTDKKNRIAQVADAAAERKTIVRPPGQSDSCRFDQSVAARVSGDLTGASAATGDATGASAATGDITGASADVTGATGDIPDVDLVTAIVSMMPPAWENDRTLSPRVRAMFEYFALFEEKNDGPAAVVFGDGTVIGARLDRLGLRPLRTLETSEYLCVFSEAGQISVPTETVLARGRVRAGGIIYYDHRDHRVHTTDDTYEKLAAARDYPALLAAAKIDLAELPAPAGSVVDTADSPADGAVSYSAATRYRAYFLDQESFRYFMDPMIADGAERVSAMGFGAAINAFTDVEANAARFFSQRFAQVTNPPLDSIREADGMTLRVALGPRADRHERTPMRRIVLETPVLTADDLAVLYAQREVPVATFDAVFAVQAVDDTDDTADTGVHDFVAAIDRLGDDVVAFARTGGIAVLSDRAISASSAALPVIVTIAAVNRRLVDAGLRLKVSLIADTGQVESSHHLAAALGFGAAAVHPHSVARRAADLAPDGDGAAVRAGFDRWARAAEKSLMKTMGRVGLCTVESYLGGEFFEPNFLDTDDDHLRRWFPELRTPVGGVGLAPIVASLLRAHRAAFDETPRAATDLPTARAVQGTV